MEGIPDNTTACGQGSPGRGEDGPELALRTVLAVGRGPSSGDSPGALRTIAKEALQAENAAEVTGLLNPHVDLVLIRESIPPEEALAILQDVRTSLPAVPVVVVAEHPAVEMAVRFIRAGAYDYLGGPLDDEKLRRLADGMRSERSLAARRSDRFFSHECPPGVPLVGRSGGTVKALEMIRLVSQSRCNPILICGQTGTGKELAARAVHAWRGGRGDQFVAVNCAALTASLLESELFGHVKGAFTGADREKVGLFELAGSGSIFLDEISEMPSELQAKLLRVLQEQTFRKVGGTRDITCSATIIASSNRDLPREVQAGRFRRDLYYRLAVFPVTIPPLRCESRRSDIPLLAEYFIQTSTVCTGVRAHRLSEDAVQALLRHDWPGNVRELRNVIERAMILARGPEITAACLTFDHGQSLALDACGPVPATQVVAPALPGCASCDSPDASRPAAGDAVTAKGAARSEDVANARAGSPVRIPPAEFSLEAAERELIVRALRETGWQRTRAASLLGITRVTLYAKLKRYDIKIPGGKTAPGEVESPGPAEQSPLEAACA